MDIPARARDITPEWMSTVLDADVRSIDADHMGEGVGILAEVSRLTLDLGGGDGDGPTSVIVKCSSPAAENVALSSAMGFYDREVSFYRHLADEVALRVPRCFHGDVSEDGAAFVLVLEDIVGARCPDQIEGLGPEDADRILATICGLHAELWESDRLYGLDWLPPMNNPMYQGARELAAARFPAFRERFTGRIPERLLDWAAITIPRYHELLAWWDDKDVTFAHVDCRAENYLFGGSAGDDAVTVVDFQLATRHSAAWDVANLLGGSLRPEVRAAHETELVESYHRRLVAHGVDHPLDKLWRQYRMSLLQQSLSSVAVSDLQGGNERGGDLLVELMCRPFDALADQEGVEDLIAELG